MPQRLTYPARPLPNNLDRAVEAIAGSSASTGIIPSGQGGVSLGSSARCRASTSAELGRHPFAGDGHAISAVMSSIPVQPPGTRGTDLEAVE